MSKTRDTALKQIARGAGITFIGLAFFSLFGFFYRLLIARYLGPGDYGKIALAMTILALGTAVSVIGLNAGLQRYVSYFIGKKDKKRIVGTIKSGFRISFPLSLFISLIVFIFSPQIALHIFHNPELTPLFRIFSLIIPFNAAILLLKSLFLSFKKPEYSVYVESFGEQFLKLILTLVVVLLGGKILGVAYAYLAALSITLIFGFLLLQFKVFKVFKSKIMPVFDYRTLLIFSVPLFLSRILSLVMGWTDTFLLGYFKNETFVGLYNVALPLATSLTIFFTAFGALFFPIVTELYARKKITDIRNVYTVILKWIFLVTFPIFFLMILFPREIIRILFGGAYLPASVALVMLCFGYFIHATIGPANLGLQTFKKTRYILYITLGMATLNVILNILLIPRFGMIGAAAATTTTLFLTHLSFFFKFRTIIKFKIPFKYYLKYILASAIPLTAIYFIIKIFFSPSTPLILAIAFAIFLVINAVLLLLFKSFAEEDFMILRAIEKKLGLNLGFIKKIISRFL